MKFLDVALATMIGVSAISGIVAWNPGTADVGSHRLMIERQLRGTLISYLAYRGLPWIEESPPGTICADLERLSGTTAISASVDSFSCGPSPPQGALIATVTLRLGSRDVTLQAWSRAEG